METLCANNELGEFRNKFLLLMFKLYDFFKLNISRYLSLETYMKLKLFGFSIV
jgi:hypothetical protein